MSDPLSKRDLRIAIAKDLAGLSPDLRGTLDEQISQRLRALNEFRGASQLLGYLPLDDEPNIVPVLEEAIAAGKRVYMPIVDEASMLHYVRWEPSDGKRAAAYGRWTPSSSEQPANVFSVVLVPGRAFDREGYRLGRGKGCYDRSLGPMKPLGATVGIAYSVQLLSCVPREQHDHPVDLIVTERETVRRPDVSTDHD